MSMKMIINGEKLAKYLDKVEISKREFLDYLQESDAYITHDEELGNQLAVENEILTMDIYKGQTALGYDVACRLVYALGADVAESIIDWDAVREMGLAHGRHIFSPAEERLFRAIMEFKLEPRNQYAYQG